MDDPPRNDHTLILAFGLPVVTTLIVMGSMYVGHIITTTSERPTEVRVQGVQPKIDVNVPQGPAPNVHVSATAPQVDVHVPPAPPVLPPMITVNTPPTAPPMITVNTPPVAPPNITVNPSPATVTVIDRREIDKPKTELAAAPAPVPAPAPQKPAESAVALKSSSAAASAPVVAKPSDPLGNEPTLDNLYAHAARYIDLYCHKHGLDPASETRRWNNVWRSKLDQAISDNIDSSEQSYINRVVIAKRDCFAPTASPDKVVEACRLMLRYRDGQLAWLQAMKDALTNENLKKTMSFLAQGP
jgi:hypothetical protein